MKKLSSHFFTFALLAIKITSASGDGNGMSSKTATDGCENSTNADIPTDESDMPLRDGDVQPSNISTGNVSESNNGHSNPENISTDDETEVVHPVANISSPTSDETTNTSTSELKATIQPSDGVNQDIQDRHPDKNIHLVDPTIKKTENSTVENQDSSQNSVNLQYNESRIDSIDDKRNIRVNSLETKGENPTTTVTVCETVENLSPNLGTVIESSNFMEDPQKVNSYACDENSSISAILKNEKPQSNDPNNENSEIIPEPSAISVESLENQDKVQVNPEKVNNPAFKDRASSRLGGNEGGDKVFNESKNNLENLLQEIVDRISSI